jgi:hypothetical protein
MSTENLTKTFTVWPPVLYSHVKSLRTTPPHRLQSGSNRGFYFYFYFYLIIRSSVGRRGYGYLLRLRLRGRVGKARQNLNCAVLYPFFFELVEVLEEEP